MTTTPTGAPGTAHLPEPLRALAPLLAAECHAEATAAGIEPDDLEQAVWLRLLERLDGSGPASPPGSGPASSPGSSPASRPRGGPASRRPGGVPDDPADWLRRAVRAEARRARRTAVREHPYGGEEPPPFPFPVPDAGHEPGPESAALTAERRRVLRHAIDRAPAHCRRLLAAMLSPNDPTYREIAGELGISQGSLGPMRSRCLGCLRRMLPAEVAAPAHRGMVR
ncbi:sigma-70 family RNA polymerase sigma factor [Streptomyces sp. NPDC045431]|uniref:sigma-70 family RNA polymerase sigma factor n=1 Tax=Streptomyces sp. NPDC045431 TaxID=3155613 RepID=UPI0033D7271D